MYVRTSPSRQSGLSGYRGLGDVATVQSEITAAAARYGVDPNLALAVAKQESGFQQTSGSGTLRSSSGALGVMQLMPATAAGLGVDPNNEQQNIDGGVRLLSQLLTQFNGNVSNALAAYNAGSLAVQKYGGVPPYAETQNYVSSILANYSPGSATAPDSSSSSDSSLASTFDLSSILPSPDAQYSIGGLVLSGSDLVTVGGIALAALVVFSIL